MNQYCGGDGHGRSSLMATCLKMDGDGEMEKWGCLAVWEGLEGSVAPESDSVMRPAVNQCKLAKSSLGWSKREPKCIKAQGGGERIGQRIGELGQKNRLHVTYARDLHT